MTFTDFLVIRCTLGYTQQTNFDRFKQANKQSNRLGSVFSPAGMNDFIRKPFDTQELIQKNYHLVNNKSRAIPIQPFSS